MDTPMISRRAVLSWPVLPIAGAVCHAEVSDGDAAPAQSSDGGRPQQASLLSADTQVSGVALAAVATRLQLEPGASSPSHRHSGFVVGYVAAGAVTVQVDGNPVRTYQQGEAFWEPTGAVHQRFENASTTTAVVIAVHVGPAGQPVVLPPR